MDRRAVAAVVQRLRAHLRARRLRCRGREGLVGSASSASSSSSQAPPELRRRPDAIAVAALLTAGGCNAPRNDQTAASAFMPLAVSRLWDAAQLDFVRLQHDWTCITARLRRTIGASCKTPLCITAFAHLRTRQHSVTVSSSKTAGFHFANACRAPRATTCAAAAAGDDADTSSLSPEWAAKLKPTIERLRARDGGGGRKKQPRRKRPKTSARRPRAAPAGAGRTSRPSPPPRRSTPPRAAMTTRTRSRKRGPSAPPRTRAQMSPRSRSRSRRGGTSSWRGSV